jgi:hypothetical protein
MVGGLRAIAKAVKSPLASPDPRAPVLDPAGESVGCDSAALLISVFIRLRTTYRRCFTKLAFRKVHFASVRMYLTATVMEFFYCSSVF